MSENSWSGNQHHNDPKFIEVSIRMPQQVFKHNKYDCSLRFRQAGNRELDEAVIYFPGIYETDGSFFRMVPLFENEGYRVIVVTTGNHRTFETLIQTFDQLLRYLRIKRIHVIGCDYGGFVSLQVQNTVGFSAKILSLCLINTYTQNTQFIPREITAFSIFGSFVANSKLSKEIENVSNNSQSAQFIEKEIGCIDMSEAKARIDLRMAITPPLYLHLPAEAIMSIEPLDRELITSAAYLPSLTIAGVKQALMKTGADWPHLESPNDLFSYILCHIKKWTPTVEPTIESK